MTAEPAVRTPAVQFVATLLAGLLRAPLGKGDRKKRSLYAEKFHAVRGWSLLLRAHDKTSGQHLWNDGLELYAVLAAVPDAISVADHIPTVGRANDQAPQTATCARPPDGGASRHAYGPTAGGQDHAGPRGAAAFGAARARN